MSALRELLDIKYEDLTPLERVIVTSQGEYDEDLDEHAATELATLRAQLRKAEAIIYSFEMQHEAWLTNNEMSISYQKQIHETLNQLGYPYNPNDSERIRLHHAALRAELDKLRKIVKSAREKPLDACAHILADSIGKEEK